MSGIDWLLYVLVVACAGVGLAYGLTTRRLVLAEAAGSVADLHALLGAAGIATPVVLVGHSYGGLVARLVE
jgi:pimeloyl-ACP methyl ester carboxylesterase